MNSSILHLARYLLYLLPHVHAARLLYLSLSAVSALSIGGTLYLSVKQIFAGGHCDSRRSGSGIGRSGDPISANLRRWQGDWARTSHRPYYGRASQTDPS